MSVTERAAAPPSAVAPDEADADGLGSLFVRTTEWTMNVAAWRYRVNFLEQQRRLGVMHALRVVSMARKVG